MDNDNKTVDYTKLEEIAKEVRISIVKMIANAGSGHPGGSLSMVEILVSLFFNVMKTNPVDLSALDTDRFHLSKGHGCPALYAVLAEAGYFDKKELMTLREFGSNLQGHPHCETRGVEMPSGSLGQGLSIACGMALGERLNKSSRSIFTVLGDGECQEGQVWEAASFASHYNLDNLYAFVDCNGLQIDGKVTEIMNVHPQFERWESFGFEVRAIDGHSFEEIIRTVNELKDIKGKPKVILADTVKGKGVSFMEHNVGFHGKAPSPEEIDIALGDIG